MEITISYRAVQWEKWIALIGGAFMVVIGSLVVIGWYTHNLFLIQVRPPFAAMQFNTALCIGWSGLGLACLALGYSKLSRLLSLLAGGLAFFIACQYFFGTDLGIDNLFFTYDLPNSMKFPGRMAFNTSAALTVGNFSVFCLSSKEKDFSSALALICSALVSSVAFASFIGYFTSLEAETAWLDFARMAVHTAASCLVFGLCSFVYGIQTALESKFSRVALPASVMIGMLSASLATWQVFRTQEYVAVQRLAEQQSAGFKSALDEKIEEELLAIRRMAERWEILDGYTEKLWQKDAENYLNDFIGLEGLGIYNKDLKQERQLVKDSLFTFAGVHSISAEDLKTLKEGKMVFAPSEQKRGLLFFCPLVIRNEFSGLLTGGIDLGAVLKHEIERLYLGNFLISLYFGEQIIFSGGDLFSPVLGKPIRFAIGSKAIPWEVEMILTKAVSLPAFLSLHVIILIAGLSITILGGVLVYIGQNLQKQKKSLERVNSQLQEASKRADSANVAKGAFLATMSHEIRTPLNAIVGTIELLQETEGTAVQKKYFDRITNATKILLDLISDILDFSRIEAGGVKLESVPIDFFSVAKGVAENLTLKAREKRLDVFLDCPSQPLPEVFSDPVRLQQILSNLGNNSLKFTDRGFLLLRFKVKSQSPEVLLVRFEMVDTGIGIAKENQTKLFQKFSQIGDSLAHKYGGVGLGLSICKKLVDLMGGEIGVVSEVGKGSNFWFEIPFQKGAKPSPPLYSAANRSIFLEDEKETERQILETYLRDWGAEVCTDATRCDLAISASLTEGKKKMVLIVDRQLPVLPEGVLGAIVRPIVPGELYKWVK